MGNRNGKIDVERLIREVTDLVVAGLGSRSSDGSAPQPTRGHSPALFPPEVSRRRPRELLFLLPAHTPRLAELAESAASLSLDGWRLHAFAADELLAGPEGLAAEWTGIRALSSASVSKLLASLKAGDAVVLGSIGFGLAARLARLDDDDPFVRLAVAARLKGLPVLLLRDDLEPSSGVGGEIASRANDLLRDLERLGLEVLPARGLERRLAKAAAAGSVAERDVGGLLTEVDVERLFESGERRLVLSARTLITPLARTRASALGLELVEKGAD